MEKIKLDIHEDVIAALRKIRASQNGEVELLIPEGSVLFENILNLKLLKKEGDELNKPISFSTTDEAGNNLLDLLEGGNSPASSDFVSREVSLDAIMGDSSDKQKGGKKFAVPSISLGFLKNLKIPKLSLKGRTSLIIVLLLVLGLLGFGGYQLMWRVPKAELSVTVDSQPLIKSVEIQVKPNVTNNVADRILAGFIAETVVSDSKTTETTGEKLVGEKAEGKIEIANYKVGAEAEFDDGEEVYFEDDDDMIYFLKDDVTVPGATEEIQPDLTKIVTPGKASVGVIAADIGKDFNLDEDENLKFDDFSSDDYTAEVQEDIDGGSSDIASVVSQGDLDLLSEELFAEIQEQGNLALGGTLSKEQILINGSVVGALAIEEFSAELDEEVEELTLTQTINFQGLSYREEDLDAILVDLLEGFIPSGFELSDEEKDTNVEILGNTDATVLNLSQADLQVTIKAFVIPEIDEKQLLEDLVGVSISEAEKILGKVRNVDNYEIKLDPNIPFLRRIPGNVDNITLKVKRN